MSARLKSKTTNWFIDKAKELHGDRYDYSLVNYINLQTNVKIICSDHGIFSQKPSDHLKNRIPCPMCAKNRH